MEAELLKSHQIQTKNFLLDPKQFSENLSLELLCDVIFLLLPWQSNIPCFTMAIFHLDDYYWQPDVSNLIKFKLKTSN